MRKRIILPAAAITLITASAVFAASVHFKNGNPTFSDLGTTLKSCFCLAGLGNKDVTITIKATGFATTLCTNKGGNTAPGQNKTPVAPTVQQSFPATEIKNGNLCACLTTAIPPAPSAKDAGCPNSNWSTSLTDVEFTSAEVIVVQGGKVVLDKTFKL